MVKSFNKWTAKMKSVEHLSILNKNVKQNILKNIYNLQQQKDEFLSEIGRQLASNSVLNQLYFNKYIMSPLNTCTHTHSH